jgi:hypothetical protein
VSSLLALMVLGCGQDADSVRNRRWSLSVVGVNSQHVCYLRSHSAPCNSRLRAAVYTSEWIVPSILENNIL